ncbi:MAG: DUF2834 domain-containing protein [Proteobacteria bacterium]|nr:DUF2834 domain-containing protein [Pseudomonadota bacterium]
MKRFLVAVVLVDFAILTGYAVVVTGLSGLIDLLASGDLWVYQLTFDFLISLGIAVAWMIGDARKRGVSWRPYLVLTLLLGSIGPLLYIVVHAIGHSKVKPVQAPGLAARSRASA